MKTFKQFITEQEYTAKTPFSNKNVRILDRAVGRLTPDTKSPPGNSIFAGAVSWGSARIIADLWVTNPSEISGVSLKPDERVFRYTTYKTQIGDLYPMVKVNIEKGLVYFLTDDAKETGNPSFEKKGTKVIWLTLFDDILN